MNLGKNKMKNKTKMQNPQQRQGDILFEIVASLPGGAQKQAPSAEIVVALGEATGHHHTVTCAEPADWWKTADGDIYVQLTDQPKATHQEHGLLEFAPRRLLRVRRQREYSPEAIRNVQD